MASVNNSIFFRFKAVMEGAWEKVSTQMEGLGRITSRAVRSMMSSFSQLAGMIGGKVSDAFSTLGGMVSGFLSGGLIGGFVAATAAGIKKYSDHIAEECKRIEQSAKDMADSVRRGLERANDALRDGVRLLKEYVQGNVDAEKATQKANAARLSENAHDTRMGTKANQLDVAVARLNGASELDIAEMRLAQITDEAAKKRQDAADRVSMAEQELAEIARDTAEEERRLLNKIEDLRTTRENLDAIDTEAAAKAQKTISGLEKELAALHKESDARLESAKAKLLEAQRSQEVADADGELAKVTALQGVKSVRDAAEAERHRAEEAERLVKERAEREAAAARAAQEKADADRKLKDAIDKRSLLEKARSAAEGRFNSEFELWRDTERAQADVDAQKQREADLERFQKSVNRYGGKWRIDEAAGYMLRGDEAGLAERLKDWRRSSRFDAQTEKMVLAAAAQQNEHVAEQKLAEIAANTADLAAKVDELLLVKEGG